MLSEGLILLLKSAFSKNKTCTTGMLSAKLKPQMIKVESTESGGTGYLEL